MKKPPKNTQYTKLMALLGLASSKKNTVDNCPDTQQIALFIEGSLKKKKREHLLSHMNQCSHCRAIWLETAEYLESLPEPSKSSEIVKKSWTIKHLASPAPLFAGAMTATLLLLVTLLPTSSLNQQIDSRYEIVLNQANTEIINTLSTYNMPWENTVFGFSKKINTAQQNAFGAGLWNGKNELLSIQQELPSKLALANKTHWLKTDWRYHYQLSRFLLLLWAETQHNTDAIDWNTHEKIIRQLREKLTTLSKEEEKLPTLIESIDQIAEKINTLIHHSGLSEKKALQRLLEITMQKYSPG